MKIPDIEITHERFIEAYGEQEYNNLLVYIHELKIFSNEKGRYLTEVYTSVNDFYNRCIVGNTIEILGVKVKFDCVIRY